MTYTLLCDSKIMEKIIVSYLSGYKKVNDDNPDFFVVDEVFLISKGFTLKDFFQQNLETENVLFITSSANPELLMQLIECRRKTTSKTRYIIKPFTKEALIEKAKQVSP